MCEMVTIGQSLHTPRNFEIPHQRLWTDLRDEVTAPH